MVVPITPHGEPPTVATDAQLMGKLTHQAPQGRRQIRRPTVERRGAGTGFGKARADVRLADPQLAVYFQARPGETVAGVFTVSTPVVLRWSRPEIDIR